MKNSNYNNTNKAWSPRPEKATYVGKRSTMPVYEEAAGKQNFMNALSETRDYIYNPNISITENGMIGYASTGSALLDLNFAVASLRGADNKKIVDMFRKAFNENPIWAMRWLFYCRDCTQGLGERNLFRVCIKDMTNNGLYKMISSLIPIIAEYGREDDLFCLLDTPCKESVISYCKNKLNKDIKILKNNGYGEGIETIK